MSADESGRSVLVSGASRGIGAAVAQAFRDAGHRVAGLSRSGEAPPGVLALKADVADDEQVEQAVAAASSEHGPVQVLVANAGVTDDRLLVRMPSSSMQEVLEVNLVGAHRLTRAVLPGMVRARAGSLVYVSSVVALSGAAGQTSYAASKAGLIGFARSVALEYGRRGVRSNVVAPGFIDTDMTRALGEQAQEQHRLQVPLGRVGTVEDVARVVAFLGGEAAAYVNGAVIPVDGGMGMGH